MRTLPLLALLLPSVAAAAWPEEGAWVPVTSGGIPLVDEAFDATGPDRLDLVGDANHPVAYWSVDDDSFYLRMRLSDTALDSSGSYPMHGDAWGVLLDTDDTDDTYDYALVLSSYGVSLNLYENDTDGGGGLGDAAETLLEQWDTPLNDEVGLAEVSATGVDHDGFGSDEDWFVDLRVDRDELERLTHIHSGRRFRVALATGYNTDDDFDATVLTADQAGWGNNEGLADADDGLSDEIIFDEDGDGLDYVDEIVEGTDPDDRDSDDDGLEDGAEISDTGTDPNQADTDGDGLNDGDEVGQNGTDPNQADTDNDGLNDGDEVDQTHTDPINPDTDSDGYTDGAEVDAGTDPTDASDMPGQEPEVGDPNSDGDDAFPLQGGDFTGGACSTAPRGSSGLGLLLATLLLARRRR